ncbi:phage/plasmid replication, II/X family protein [Burkholderia pseudomallei MSHR4377]|uniref:phage/plasmid replication protein, II/X family n=1 Tax=Burkholderia pseudomallei TaxID=28450 RepID=UPI000536D497|nr:phage/plasmid replication protein, II/X family [Burkholderia pseudomallei]KGU92529.1 phage/plasmid replication, II/X family protein [Burkholderia pseudomallei MSHR4377]
MKRATALHGQVLHAQPVSAYAICNQQSGVFIDGIHILAPCLHRPLGNQGEWVNAKTGAITLGAGAILESLEDGYGTVFIQSKQISRQSRAARAIYIDCCPPKVLQGHNVFGHAVLHDYVYEILDRVTKSLGIDVRPEDRALWRAGAIHLTEIHLTANFTCPRNLIVPIMDAVDRANRQGKQRILPTWIKLGLTPSGNSTSHTLTLYDKLEEMAGLFPWPTTRNQRRLLQEARDGGLRAEVKLHSQGLKSLSETLGGIDLTTVASWARVNVAAVFFDVFRGYEVVHAVQPVPTVAQVQLLKLKELNVYTNWLLGRSLKEQFSNRGTARRYATVIEQKTGVNIRVARWSDEARPAVDLKDLFAPTNVRAVPDWALGTRWYSPPCSLSDANNDGCDGEE